jgi:hypothetical protein
MSYHDYARPTTVGMEVVNPLHRQQKRLSQLESFLREIASETGDDNLKEKIEKVLDEYK